MSQLSCRAIVDFWPLVYKLDGCRCVISGYRLFTGLWVCGFVDFMLLPVPIPTVNIHHCCCSPFLLQLDRLVLRKGASYGWQNQETPKTKHHYEHGLLSKDAAYDVNNQHTPKAKHHNEHGLQSMESAYGTQNQNTIKTKS